MDLGRVQAIVIASREGNVIYERFYEKLSENDKADLRAALASASDQAHQETPEATEFASRYRDSAVAFRTAADLVLYVVGSGEYDELNLSELLRALAHMLQDSLRRPPSEALLLDNYGKLVLTVDEMICEGLLDKVDAAAA